MDVDRPDHGDKELDARQQLQADLDSLRAERDGMERAIAGDADRSAAIRTALDAMTAAVWRDVFAQQQRSKRDDIWIASLKLEWLGSLQFPAIGILLVICVASTMVSHVAGPLFSAGLYAIFLVIGYFTSRDQSLAQLKKARKSYLGDDGRDVRFVAFTHAESGLHHPLIGFDGPRKNGTFADRSWKIPGVRDDEALKEVFVEVIDDRHASVLLTRFPEKKPTLVHADLENPFIRAYGVFFQRALERQMPSVAEKAEEFRQAILRVGEVKKLGARFAAIESELRELDGTQAILSHLPLSIAVRNRLLRQVVVFRMGDAAARRGTMVFSEPGFDIGAVMETAARASAATFIPFSFSSLKIGYVGQGASQVARTFDAAKRARSIVFIEDGDKLFNNTGATGFEPMRREVQQAFLKAWDALDDRSDVWVVASVHDRDSIDPTVIAHFGTLLDVTPKARADAGPAMEDVADRPIFDESFELPEAASEKVRILSAMFAHVDAMERQAIAVPRGVLLCAQSAAARRAAAQSLIAQSGLHSVSADIHDLDTAIGEARAAQPALVFVDLPPVADPGPIAHLCVLIDTLIDERAPIFVVASVTDLASLDPELRARFGDVIDIPGLDAATRREKLLELLGGKPIDFDFEDHLDEFERATDGMSEDRLNAYVEEAVERAAMRAIGLGRPDSVKVNLDDFGPVRSEPQTAA